MKWSNVLIEFARILERNGYFNSTLEVELTNSRGNKLSGMVATNSRQTYLNLEKLKNAQ